MKKIIQLSEVDVDGSPKVRAEIREETVKEYQAQYALKKHGMPEPHLFEAIKGAFLIGDGMHRITAMKRAGIKVAMFELHSPSSRAECLKFALTANISHGLRRSSADKRAGVAATILEFPKLSNKEISNIAAVDDHTVAAVRKEMEADLKVKPMVERTGKDGKVRAAKKSPTSEIPRLKSQIAKENVKKEVATPDKTGYPIPTKAMPMWNRMEEVGVLTDAISRIKGIINKAVADKDKLFHEVNVSAVLADLSRAYDGIKVAEPYAVCTSCQGQLPDECSMCGGKGFISKHRYGLVPQEVKTIREKAIKK